ncbi:phosphofructokinase 2 [Actinidia rufa]|uniref:Phosphofructokinase 2 n=1 Tax=Actinidia rufa TaxID=165716 RepID=A0A7J0DZR0_9ERIC|nr:phosphofructokinase 2 [Actinidia rufa]
MWQLLEFQKRLITTSASVDMAQQAINAAHAKAESAVNGFGLVKLMGRSTGHIALHATLSSLDVDCCLIPENEFYLEGKGGLFEFLEHRIKQNGHAVLVVTEGAGQNMIPRSDAQKEERDEFGNPVFLDGTPDLLSFPVNTGDHKWAGVRSVTNQPDFTEELNIWTSNLVGLGVGMGTLFSHIASV